MGPRDLDAERKSQTIEQLEGERWPPLTEPVTRLVSVCHRLRKKPIGEFTVEDLRLMTGQEIGLLFLVPVSLQVLEREPLAEGDYYPGDLIVSLLRISSSFWQRHSGWKARLDGIIENLTEAPEEVAEAVSEYRRP